MKKAIALLVVLGLMVGLLAGCGGKKETKAEQKAEQKEVKINIAHVFATDHAVHRSLLMTNDWLKEKTNGRIKLQIYPAGTYGDQKNSVQAVRMGNLDMFIVVNAMDYYAPAGVLLAPYTFRDYDHWKKFKQSPVYSEMQENMGKAMGVKQLDLFTFGFRHVTTGNKIAKTPEEFKGLKLRVVNFAPYPEAANVLGAAGTPIPLADLYMALHSGVVDGQENPFSQIFTLKFYEVQKNVILTGHMLATDGWMMSLKKWDSLSKEDQEIVKEAFKKSAEFIDNDTQQQEKDLLQKLQQSGMTVIEVDKAPFMARAKDILSKYPDWQNYYQKIQAIK